MARPIRQEWVSLAVWVAFALAAGLLLARTDQPLFGKYTFSWCAVPFVVLAVIGRRHSGAALAVIAVTGAAGLFVGLRGVVWIASGVDHAASPYIVAGLVVIGLSIYQLATRRLDPVVLAACVLAIGLVAYWAYNAISGSGLDPRTYPPETLRSPFRAELPLMAASLAAVGFGVARGGSAARLRLGLVMPKWWHVILALWAAFGVVGAGGFGGLLTYRFMPDAYVAIGAVSDKTDGSATLLVLLTYAAMAGVGEEMLFRGALQPRAGLIVTAFLFAMIHIQYGVTPILAAMFVAGLVFGILRLYFNTTTAIISHACAGFLIALGPSPIMRTGFWILFPLVVVLLWRWVRAPDTEADSGARVRPESAA